MRLLHPVHFDGWRKGNPHYTCLEKWIQCGAKKLQQTYVSWKSGGGSAGFGASRRRRHQHTNYDELLMSGVDRSEAREMIRGQVDEVLRKWSE